MKIGLIKFLVIRSATAKQGQHLFPGILIDGEKPGNEVGYTPVRLKFVSTQFIRMTYTLTYIKPLQPDTKKWFLSECEF